MSDFTWEDPPPARDGRGVWADRLAPLREHPGRWACFGVRSAQLVTRISRGQVQGAEPGEFEARTTGQVGGKATLYVRYVGKPDLKAVGE